MMGGVREHLKRSKGLNQRLKNVVHDREANFFTYVCMHACMYFRTFSALASVLRVCPSELRIRLAASSRGQGHKGELLSRARADPRGLTGAGGLAGAVSAETPGTGTARGPGPRGAAGRRRGGVCYPGWGAGRPSAAARGGAFQRAPGNGRGARH